MTRLTISLFVLVVLFAFKGDSNKIIIGQHSDMVNSVCYSLDGSILASGSNDNKIIIWDVKAQKEKKAFVAHSVGVSDLVFTPNSKYLISAGLDNAIKVWDTETWKLYKVLNAHDKQVLSLAMSPNGKYFFSGGDDKKIVVWNTEDFSKVKELEGHSDRVLSLSVSANDKYLVSTGGDRVSTNTGNLKIWKIEDWTLAFELAEEMYAIQDAALSTGGTLVLYAGNFSDAYFLKWTENKLAAKMKVTDFGINAVALDGLQTYLGSSYNGELISWKIGGEKLVFNNHDKDIKTICLAPDKLSVISAGADGNIVLRKLN